KNTSILRLKDIMACQKAKYLAINIDSLYSDFDDFGSKNQIKHTLVSIMKGITEVFERKNNNKFKQFLYIAKGSCSKVRSTQILTNELKLIDQEKSNAFFNLLEEISRLVFRIKIQPSPV
ncbi:MAG: four helix bundle protein, partial [Bacteroidales bacterium]